MATKGITTSLLLALALATATACDKPDADGPPLPSGEQEGTREGPTTNQDGNIEGMYTLAQVGTEGPPPATLSQTGDCRIELAEATLRMEAGRFAFQNQTREVCGNGQQGEPVTHSAGGTYTIEGGSVTLTTDVGAAFGSARGSATNDDILLQELSTDAGSQPVMWRFHRRDQQLQPPGGTTGPGLAPPLPGTGN